METVRAVMALTGPSGRVAAAGGYIGETVGIDLVHQHVHAGEHYTWSHVDASVDIGAPKYVRITAPNTAVRVHLFIEVDVGVSGALVELYEDPTITGAGTAGTPRNNDRNSANTATATVYYDTTVSSDGTMLDSRQLGSAGGAARFGGMAQSRQEWILKQGEDYVVKVSPIANATAVSVSYGWYEVS